MPRFRRPGATMMAALLAIALVATGCGSDASRSSALGDLADEGIIPSYVAWTEAAHGLDDATTALCDTLDVASLHTARDRLAEARDAWKATEAVWVGPVMDRRSWAAIDWPISEDDIESLIADPDAPLDVDQLSRRVGADQRGLRAVEYVLGAKDTVLSELDSPRRCAYLVGITEVIVAEADLLVPDWTEGTEDGPAYRDEFASEGGSGLDSLVNDALFLLEAMTDAELGTALGAMDTEADPTALIEGPANLGVADLRARMRGLRLVLAGDDRSAGITPLLPDDLVDRLGRAFDMADATLVAIDGSLRDEVETMPLDVHAARDAIKDIQMLVATEVVSTLGVTIGFSDADGDSG